MVGRKFPLKIVGSFINCQDKGINTPQNDQRSPSSAPVAHINIMKTAGDKTHVKDKVTNLPNTLPQPPDKDKLPLSSPSSITPNGGSSGFSMMVPTGLLVKMQQTAKSIKLGPGVSSQEPQVVSLKTLSTTTLKNSSADLLMNLQGAGFSFVLQQLPIPANKVAIPKVSKVKVPVKAVKVPVQAAVKFPPAPTPKKPKAAVPEVVDLVEDEPPPVVKSPPPVVKSPPPVVKSPPPVVKSPPPVVESPPPWINCSICQISVEDQFEERDHYRLKHGFNFFCKVPKCNAMLKQELDIRNHLETEHKCKYIQCIDCTFWTYDKMLFRKHHPSHKFRMFKCADCPLTYLTYEECRRHYDTQHNCKCFYCDKKMSLDDLKKHSYNTECNICSSTFRCGYWLEVHHCQPAKPIEVDLTFENQPSRISIIKTEVEPKKIAVVEKDKQLPEPETEKQSPQKQGNKAIQENKKEQPPNIPCTIAPQQIPQTTKPPPAKAKKLHRKKKPRVSKPVIKDLKPTCSLCDWSTKSPRLLKTHFQKKHSEYILTCPYKCSEIFVLTIDVADHIRAAHEIKGDFGCESCKKSFVNAQQLKIHSNIIHSAPPAVRGIGRPASQKSQNYVRRKDVADSDCFNCLICNLPCSTPALLKMHSRSAHKENFFFCGFKKCLKLFLSQEERNSHYQIHLDQNPFSCGICFFRARKPFVLNKHMSIEHGRKFKCKYESCGRIFYQKTSFRRHLIGGHNEKITCKFCNSELTLTYMANHFTDVQCEICDKTFPCKKSFWKHKNGKHPSSFCAQCPAGFANRTFLIRHTLQHLQDEETRVKMLQPTTVPKETLCNELKRAAEEKPAEAPLKKCKTDNVSPVTGSPFNFEIPVNNIVVPDDMFQEPTYVEYVDFNTQPIFVPIEPKIEEDPLFEIKFE